MSTTRPETANIDQLSINTIRTLAMDAVQKAKSGHPGTPMGLAPVAYTLWQSLLRYDPKDPNWPGRDRFVLSAGHASMLLYALLHLAGVTAVNEHEKPGTPAISLDDIKQFRQLSSKTPGHPEYRLTSGVETTTGPLGQGCGNSVGMAMAQRWLAQRYNRPGFPVFDYRVYVLAGDGDMMEGVSNEAASLAGHLKLSNLLWIYDSNRITIEGSTDLAFSDDVAARLRALGWHTLDVPDANDTNAVKHALTQAQSVTDRPTLIVVHSHIGFGAPHKQDTREAHGEPLGEEEIRAAKRAYGWPEDLQFLVPDGVYRHFAEGIGARGAALRAEWQEMLARYRMEFPDLARELDLMNLHELPPGWDADIPSFPADAKGIASRDSSRKGAERHCAPRALVAGRCRRPGALDQIQPDVRGRRQLLCQQLRRPQLAFRYSRAHDGVDQQRPGAGGATPVRLRLPDLQRLHEAADPTIRNHGIAGDLHLHPRFHRRGRGRANSPAD